ncbi:MAG TPA: protein translocase subunit SecF [Anaerolineae bacterium]|nr:protein translocase subunit SecF [Anaerolineae bacterium]
MFDIVGKRTWTFLLSALVVVPGLLSLLIFGLRLSVEFTGGSLLELQFHEARGIQPAEVKAVLGRHGLTGTLVQTAGEDAVLVRAKPMDSTLKKAIEEELRERFGDFTELRFESVGPSVGREMGRRAAYAVALAAIAILLYISWAFRHAPSPIRYGLCAIIAMLHDVAVVVGLASIWGWLFNWEVDPLFLAALLAVIGFSVHDSIVVLDRIRENMARHRGEPFEEIVNHSILQTLERSVTTLLIVLFTLTALALLGGVTIRPFVVTLLVGIISGTYSSIFIAASLLVVWERGEVGRLFRRLRRQEAIA